MAEKRSAKKLVVICFVVVAIIGLVVAFLWNRNRDFPYTEEIATRQTIETYYTFTGNVEPMDSQRVVSTMNLSVKNFYVKEGDAVKAGDVLFDLDDSAILSSIDQITASLEIAKINYESARGLNKDQQTIQVNNNLESAKLSRNNALNAFTNAKENFERMNALFEANAISQSDLDSVQNALNSAKSGLDSADLALNAAQTSFDNLNASISQSIRIAGEQLNQAQATYDNVMRQKNDLTVKAEVGGEVVEVFVTENETLIMGTRIMDIVDYDNLKISIRVDEYDLPAVTLGKDVYVKINALNIEVPGTVESISREAIPLANISYFPASIKIASNPVIRVGLSAEVRVLNQRAEDTLAVSMKAIRFDDENMPYVYLKDAQGKAAATYVVVGINDAGSVEILEGISEGDVVLIPVNNASSRRLPMMMGR